MCLCELLRTSNLWFDVLLRFYQNTHCGFGFNIDAGQNTMTIKTYAKNQTQQPNVCV